MVATPATTDEVSWNFNYVYWPETVVTTAINAGINALFPHFYVPTATATGTSAGVTVTPTTSSATWGYMSLAANAAGTGMTLSTSIGRDDGVKASAGVVLQDDISVSE